MPLARAGSDVVVDPVADEQDVRGLLADLARGDPEDLRAGLTDVKLVGVELHGEELQQAEQAQVPVPAKSGSRTCSTRCPASDPCASGVARVSGKSSSIFAQRLSGSYQSQANCSHCCCESCHAQLGAHRSEHFEGVEILLRNVGHQVLHAQPHEVAEEIPGEAAGPAAHEPSRKRGSSWRPPERPWSSGPCRIPEGYRPGRIGLP